MSSVHADENRGKPKLSICIATYNRGRFIGETLDSIVGQLNDQVELIVVDGASPDNTEEVMRQYFDRYPQINYVRESENSGVDCDYDKAVGYATGLYCWLMTDDDLLVPGAISRVCDFLDGTRDLVIVNAEVRSADFSRVLHPSRLKIESDRNYDSGERSKCFSETASCLSFIGGVVIRRDFWLERDRESYYGTLFIHVGVIFQNPPIENVTVISDPLIRIRYGNAMWSARGFEIWMFKWPELIWSFDDFDDVAKKDVCPRHPWKNLKALAFYRGVGGLSIREYRKYLADKATGLARFRAFAIAIAPAWLVNSMASIYILFFNTKARSEAYDLSRCMHSTWVSRSVANKLRVRG